MDIKELTLNEKNAIITTAGSYIRGLNKNLQFTIDMGVKNCSIFVSTNYQTPQDIMLNPSAWKMKDWVWFYRISNFKLNN